MSSAAPGDSAHDLAFTQGREAYVQGKLQSSNPYAFRGEQSLWQTWLQGWYSEYFKAKANENNQG